MKPALIRFARDLGVALVAGAILGGVGMLLGVVPRPKWPAGGTVDGTRPAADPLNTRYATGLRIPTPGR